jgi:predicted ATP-dependent endonuclease of OLD family
MSKYNLYDKGSEWRKWDLHVHTPGSINQQYKDTPESWEKFISALENLPKEIEVLGITDYYFIDGYKKVMDYRRSNRLKNIKKIFPILEFRIDTFGSGNENNLQKINLHILFDLDESHLDSEIKKVQDEFINQISISPAYKHKTKKLSRENFSEEAGSLQEGFNSLIPSTMEVFEYINSDTWRNKTFLFLGYREWCNLEKKQQLKPIKQTIYDSVQAFFSANFDKIDANQAWLNEFGKKRLLHSLDIHGFEVLDTYEFDDQDNQIPSKKYHCNTWIKADPTFEGLKQIVFEPEMRVAIQANMPEAKSGYQVIDKIIINNPIIANTSIEFNPNLNSIIGGRSTGKSILLGAIARKLRTSRKIEVDDLDYDAYIYSVANTIQVIWKDNEEENNREIEYFHQGYMYDLSRDEAKLGKLIQDILKQKGKESILNSYYKWIGENENDLTQLLSALFKVTADIDEKERKIRDKGDKLGIENELEKLTSEWNKLTATTINSDDKLEYDKLLKKLTEVEQVISTLTEDIENINTLKETQLIRPNLIYEVTSISEVNKKIIELAFEELRNNALRDWRVKLDEILLNIIESVRSEGLKRTEILENSLYIRISKAHADHAQLNEYSVRIKDQQHKLFDINFLLSEVISLQDQRVTLINKIVEAHKLFYIKICELLPALSMTNDGLQIVAKTKFIQNEYLEILNSGLNLQSYLNQSLVDFNYSTNDAYEKHVFDLFDKLLNNNITLKGGYTNQSLLNSILTESFYEIAYDIVYEDDNFKQMSDGKKAFVVLKLLLDFSDKDCPILIDQPEDDLDNRAIYSDLVQYLRKKKRVRQIIVATHNPNIVVGADSELIICANQNGIKNRNTGSKKFQYVSGGLEHTFSKKNINDIVLESQGIREHVCEILEGGDVAFKLREKKYSFVK